MTTPKKAAPKSPVKKPRKKAVPKPKPVVLEVVPTNVLEAVQLEVASLPVSLRGSALALTALHLGDVLTKTDSARDVATIAKELRACLGHRLRAGRAAWRRQIHLAGVAAVHQRLRREDRHAGAAAVHARQLDTGLNYPIQLITSTVSKPRPVGAFLFVNSP